MKIALDAAAGDFGLGPNIEGAVVAAREFGVEPVLVGPAAQIRSALADRGVSPGDKAFEIVDSPEVVAMSEEPVQACRAKPDNSIMTCGELVTQGKAQGLVSAGHSGATMVAALWHLKRLPGVLRPAIGVHVPTSRGMALLLDAGANAECKPWHLLQFGMMGSIYAKHILKISSPKVGILSMGEEENKGNELVKEAIPLLKSSGVGFYGPIEGRDITAGTTDVIVCDGFVGNIAIKLIEGTASTIFTALKEEILKSPLSRLGGLLLKGAFVKMKRRMSYDEYGGAPLLGVNGTVIIGHGRSNAKAVANALRVAKESVEGRVNERIKESLDQVKSHLETARI